jgi:hypothetical protein
MLASPTSNKQGGRGRARRQGKGKLKGEEVEDMLRKIPYVPRGSTARHEPGHPSRRLRKVEQDLAVLARQKASVREEVRPIKSEITIFDFQNFDFAKYVTLWCKTHQNQRT